jgi:hypothetical protein
MPSQLVPRAMKWWTGKATNPSSFARSRCSPPPPANLTVEPLTAQVQVERRNNSRRRRANDPFNDPFFRIQQRPPRSPLRSTCRALNSEHPIRLPENKSSATGDLAVGKYSMSARLGQNLDCETNDAVTLNGSRARHGKHQDDSHVRTSRLPPDFEAFDPEIVRDQIKRGPDKI